MRVSGVDLGSDWVEMPGGEKVTERPGPGCREKPGRGAFQVFRAGGRGPQQMLGWGRGTQAGQGLWMGPNLKVFVSSCEIDYDVEQERWYDKVGQLKTLEGREILRKMKKAVDTKYGNNCQASLRVSWGWRLRFTVGGNPIVSFFSRLISCPGCKVRKGGQLNWPKFRIFLGLWDKKDRE